MFRYHHGESRRRTEPAGMSLATGLGWMALGAGIMYLLDPLGGGRRRALVRDKLARGYHEASNAARTTAIRARDHARGYAHEVRARLTEGPVDDRVLAERVRSQIGRAVTHPGLLEVHTHGGCVTLRGPVLRHEVDRLIRTVYAVRGVRDVVNVLTVRETPGSVPGLQGEGSLQSRS